MPETDTGHWQWYKWFPERSRSSPRWRVLTIADKGLFRECYDIAAISKPRGALYLAGEPMTDAMIAQAVGIPLDTCQQVLHRLSTMKLVERDGRGALCFPDWNRHQRNTPSRRRAKAYDDPGAKVAQDWRKSGTIEVEVEVEEEYVGAEKTPPHDKVDDPSNQWVADACTLTGRRLPDDGKFRTACLRYAALCQERHGATSSAVLTKCMQEKKWLYPSRLLKAAAGGGDEGSREQQRRAAILAEQETRDARLADESDKAATPEQLAEFSKRVATIGGRKGA